MASKSNDIKSLFKQFMNTDPKSSGKLMTLEQITRFLENGGIVNGRILTKDDVERCYVFKYGSQSEGLNFDEFEKFLKYLAKTKYLNYDEMINTLRVFTLLPPTNLVLEIRSGNKFEKPPCSFQLDEDENKGV